MKISKKIILTVILGLSFLTLAITPALALDISQGMSDVQTEAGFAEQDLTVTIGKIIRIVLSFLGLIALILFLVGGFKWMSSGGEEEKISSAKKLMTAAVVGLFIVIIAYAATGFIIDRLTEGTTECVEDGDCEEAGTPRCLTSKNICVECLTGGASGDCDEPATYCYTTTTQATYECLTDHPTP